MGEITVWIVIGAWMSHVFKVTLGWRGAAYLSCWVTRLCSGVLTCAVVVKEPTGGLCNVKLSREEEGGKIEEDGGERGGAGD